MLKRTFIFQYDEKGDVSYTLSQDFTPELYAKMAVRMATFIDSDLIVKELADNGYTDVEYRLKNAADNSMSAFFKAITGGQPIVTIIKPDGAEKTESKDKASEDDRPVIEALVG